MIRRVFVIVLVDFVLSLALHAQERPFARTEDVIYGRADGTALTLDVFRPEGGNGLGVIYVVSGGWFSAHEHIAPRAAQPLLDRGYTVFAVVHGSNPRFHIPEIFEQLERSVRFVRRNAAVYGIDPKAARKNNFRASHPWLRPSSVAPQSQNPRRICPIRLRFCSIVAAATRTSSERCSRPHRPSLIQGAKHRSYSCAPPNRIGVVGGSAGGHISLMLATRGGPGKAGARDPVDRESSAVQAAACFFPPTDFLNYGRPGENALGEGILVDYRSAFGDIPTAPEAKRKFAESISPLYHVKAGVPPVFIIHGDADRLVPIQQAQAFLEKVKAAGGQGKLDTRAGAAHGWAGWEADVGLFADWFDLHLRPKRAAAVPGPAPAAPEKPAFEAYLRESAVSKEVIDRFLEGPAWARFDPELGYTLGSYMPQDGVDGSATISTARPDGARTSFLYADRPCRINTYGDSFTQCHQVSDGETWQEYLAGHLGEPIRNFGMGGYGVYQSYRRMVREERTGHGARHLIFYIWGDDHVRSLLRCRHAIIFRWWNHQGGRAFHNNFWPNVELDLKTGRFVEKENLLPTPEALYGMTDPERMAKLLEDDLALRLFAFKLGLIRDLDREKTDALAAHLGFAMDWSRAADLPAQADELLERYSLRATRYVLERARDFARQNDKKLLVVLFDPYRVLNELRDGRKRFDQSVVDYLVQEKIDYFEMNEVQLRDFCRQKLSFEEYMKQYFIGHYNPRGNHFFAYSIKDRIVEWLDPGPITYRKDAAESVDFKGYLPASR